MQVEKSGAPFHVSGSCGKFLVDFFFWGDLFSENREFVQEFFFQK
jgi:hypothetical protein